MAAKQYDVIVVGAGIQGSCTALYLSRRGKNVLLIEQFPLPHTRGSSHGQSRLIRTAYSEDFFTKMMPDAFAHWRNIEREANKELIWNTGLLVFARPPYDNLEASHKNISAVSPEHLQEMSLGEAATAYPLIRFPEDTKLFVDKSGGVIKASIALQTVQNLFSQNGGTILDGCPITAIKPETGMVHVETSGQKFQANSLVLCCGPWANKVLKLVDLQLPLQPQRVEVYYFKEKIPGQFSTASGLPGFICLDVSRPKIYGMPPGLEYPGLVKVCISHGIDCDPDDRDKAPLPRDDRNMLKEFMRVHFPLLEEEPAIVESCMYTLTPDESFILDYHPKHRNIVIGAGFSGSGFKFSPLVGEILGQLATGETPKHSMKPFCINRFKEQL